jgi:hypothetical protein
MQQFQGNNMFPQQQMMMGGFPQNQMMGMAQGMAPGMMQGQSNIQLELL